MRGGKLRLAVVAGLLLTAAGCHARGPRIDSVVSPTANPAEIRTITVIAGGSTNFDMRLVDRTRGLLVDAGIDVVRRAGEWGTEAAAVDDLCGETRSVDGVVFVYWDRLTLYSCGDAGVAYEAHSNEAGIDHLTRSLIRYLQPPGAAGQGARRR